MSGKPENILVGFRSRRMKTHSKVLRGVLSGKCPYIGAKLDHNFAEFAVGLPMVCQSLATLAKMI